MRRGATPIGASDKPGRSGALLSETALRYIDLRVAKATIPLRMIDANECPDVRSRAEGSRVSAELTYRDNAHSLPPEYIEIPWIGMPFPRPFGEQ